MHKITLFILSAVFAVALAEGQYYIPRAYYTIDAEGHESARVPLRRLRRSLQPNYNRHPGGSSDANAIAISNVDGSATANSYASNGWRDNGGHPGSWNNGGNWGPPGGNWGPPGGNWGPPGGNWGPPGGNNYGSSKPVGSGQTSRMFGAVQGQSVSASTSVGVGADGNGYYYQSASTH